MCATIILLDDVYSVFSFFFFKQKTAYEMRISDWSFRRVLFRSRLVEALITATHPQGTEPLIAAVNLILQWFRLGVAAGDPGGGDFRRLDALVRPALVVRLASAH